MSIEKDTILIEISAYKESELLKTVQSALIQADNPNRIHLAICYQDNDLKIYNELIKIKNCRIKYFKEEETKGLCFARYHCQHMIEDEKYILQIDAHMRFVKHWDTAMIKQLLGTKDKRAIISFYPQNCKEEMMSLEVDDEIFDNPSKACVLYAKNFKDYPSYFINLSSYPIEKKDGLYRKNPFISGGNFFSFSKVHKEVYNDPDMLFYADELAMAIRLFTYGWNVYVPNESYIYHQYERKNRAFPKITNGMIKEYKRFSQLIRISNKENNLGEYDLGTKRTLKDFEKFSGIDFENRIIAPFAKKGNYELSKKEKNSYPVKRITKSVTSILQERENIYVIIIDLFGKYKECVNSCLINSTNPDNIHFIVGTKGMLIPSSSYEKYHILSITHFDIKASYSEILYKIINNIKVGTIAIVDSSCVFLNGWDEYYIKQLSLCGEKSILTSWIWCSKNGKENVLSDPYNNIIFEFSNFENYLPKLKYNKKIDLLKRTYPYKVAFNPNGFYFGYASIFKKVQFDPYLNFKEQNAIYSLRLWTFGIDIYVPQCSYIYRTISEDDICSSNNNYPVLCNFFDNDKSYSKMLPDNYLYGIGNERPKWTFFEYANINKND